MVRSHCARPGVCRFGPSWMHGLPGMHSPRPRALLAASAELYHERFRPEHFGDPLGRRSANPRHALLDPERTIAYLEPSRTPCALVEPLVKPKYFHQQDTPPFSHFTEHNIRLWLHRHFANANQVQPNHRPVQERSPTGQRTRHVLPILGNKHELYSQTPGKQESLSTDSQFAVGRKSRPRRNASSYGAYHQTALSCTQGEVLEFLVPHRVWHTVRIKTSFRFRSEPSLAGESALNLIFKVGSLFSIPIRSSDRLLE
jgi:hypothetical protein